MKRTIKKTFCKRCFFLSLLLFLNFIYFVPNAKAQGVEILQRTRVGGYSEDIAFVNQGAFANHIIILDGYEVYGIPGEARGKPPMRKLLDLRGLNINIRPNGITYIESERLFAVNDDTQKNTLFLFDHQGRPQGTRNIQYLNGYIPGHLEGLGYIPLNSSMFPDHLMMAVWDQINGGPSRVEIIRRDGQVVAEILLPFLSESIGDVTYYAPNRLLITTYDTNDSIWTIDFGGNVLASPLNLPLELGAGEGIVQLRDGRIAYVSFPQDLLFFDGNLNRLPADDRHDVIGLNLPLPQAIAWNSDTNSHLILHRDPPFNNLAYKVSAVSPSFNSAAEVINLFAGGFTRARRMTYLPDEHKIAVANHNFPRSILLYENNGALTEQLNLGIPPFARPSAVAYIPTTAEFAVRPFDVDFNKLHIYSRAGGLVRILDLSGLGVNAIAGVTYFNPAHPSGGEFLIIDAMPLGNRCVITDFNGNILGQFNIRAELGLLQPLDLATITTGGPQGNIFSILDSQGDLVVFRLR